MPFLCAGCYTIRWFKRLAADRIHAKVEAEFGHSKRWVFQSRRLVAYIEACPAMDIRKPDDTITQPKDIPTLPAISTSSLSSTNATDLNPADQHLLKWLCTAIARDGGGTLVTSLKDHYWVSSSPKKLDHLLLQSSIRKAKLLRFLEAYSPSIFQVDRNATPHWVVLNDPIRGSNPYILEEEEELMQVHCQASLNPRKDTERRLHHKVLYVLRRRQARLDRRGVLDQENHPESYKVNIAWLVKESPWELHFYLRAHDFYRTKLYAENFNHIRLEEQSSFAVVHPVMSPFWQEMVVDIFEVFLQGQCNDDFIVDQTNHKVWLATTDGDERDGISLNSETVDRLPNPSSDVTEIWLTNLVSSLVQLVKNDGATRVALGLLLHRHESLRENLGGRDLCYCYRKFPDHFTTPDGVLQLIQRPQRRDVYLEWRPSGNLTAEDEIAHLSSAMNGTKGKLPRMKVDAVGLFSVTNSRWSSAIANIMIQCCQSVGWNVEEMTAVDMTASVGGMTLGLAKAKRTFRQILALEIDATRARLCEENMENYGVKNVKVMNVDSVDAISTFPDPCCIVIDPPWGGEHYKEFKDQPPLRLGPWSLEEVISKISQSINLCVVGLRLPVTLSVDNFLDENLANTCGVKFERLMVRKLNVQLLVVLKLHGLEQDESS